MKNLYGICCKTLVLLVLFPLVSAQSANVCQGKASSSDRWQITVSSPLDRLEAFEKYDVSSQPSLPRSKYEVVGWGKFKVRSVDERKLFTSQLGPCIGLLARGFDESGNLTHMGIAHRLVSENLHKEFFKAIREKVAGRIEVFIAGGGLAEADYVARIWDYARQNDIEIMDDVTTRFYKRLFLIHGDLAYPGECGIAEIYFDNQFNPRLHVTTTYADRENMKEVLTDPDLKVEMSDK